MCTVAPFRGGREARGAVSTARDGARARAKRRTPPETLPAAGAEGPPAEGSQRFPRTRVRSRVRGFTPAAPLILGRRGEIPALSLSLSLFLPARFRARGRRRRAEAPEDTAVVVAHLLGDGLRDDEAVEGPAAVLEDVHLVEDDVRVRHDPPDRRAVPAARAEGEAAERRRIDHRAVQPPAPEVIPQVLLPDLVPHRAAPRLPRERHEPRLHESSLFFLLATSLDLQFPLLQFILNLPQLVTCPASPGLKKHENPGLKKHENINSEVHF